MFRASVDFYVLDSGPSDRLNKMRRPVSHGKLLIRSSAYSLCGKYTCTPIHRLFFSFPPLLFPICLWAVILGRRG